MRIKSFVMVFLAAAAASLAAMPTKQELLEAEGSVWELMHPALEAMRNGSKTRADVARAAARFAEKEASGAARLLLLKGAFTFMVEAGELDDAMDVLSATRALVPDIPLQNMANMIETALRDVPRSKADTIYRILDELKSDIKAQNEQEGRFDDARYCVIDLSAGPSAFVWPVSSVSDGTFNTDEYKTTKLVLRRIEPGTFKMSGKYDVTLTKPYYIGVFEVTQKQYELVTGRYPSEFKGDTRPVEHVSYGQLRGYSDGDKWPASSAVEPLSFMGRLRACTGLDFDLPTEAQWEYACRAGTTSMFNNGSDSEDDMKELGRYGGNCADGRGGYSSNHTVVGAYMPNAWGLYDMHGNVWEWCLDWAGDLSGGVTDPKGPVAGALHILRGGCWRDHASRCSSSSRIRLPSNARFRHYGFRLALPR